MKNEDFKVLDIVTNGINHWMVWSIEGKCTCESKSCPCGRRVVVKVVPVIMNGNEVEQICFNWRGEFWLNKTVDSIKPYAVLAQKK